MSVIVTKMRRADHGELEARITIDGGETVGVTREYGSWTTQLGSREVLPRYAATLQERARAFERAERQHLYERALSSLSDRQREAHGYLSDVGRMTRERLKRARLAEATVALVEAGLAICEDGEVWRPVLLADFDVRAALARERVAAT